MAEFSFYVVWTGFFWSCYKQQPVAVVVRQNRTEPDL